MKNNNQNVKIEIKRLAGILGGIQLILMISVVVLHIQIVESYKNKIAKMSASMSRDLLIVNDFRQAIISLKNTALDDFYSVEFKGVDSRTNILLPTNRKMNELENIYSGKSAFYGRISIPISLDVEHEQGPIGKIYFTYYRFEHLVWSFLMWFLTMLVSLIVFIFAKNRILNHHSKELALSESLAINEIAAGLAHDLKKVVDIIELETKTLALIQAVTIINQSVRKIIGHVQNKQQDQVKSNFDVQFVLFDPKQIISRCIKDTLALWGDRDIKIVGQLADNLSIIGSPEEFERVVNDFIMNSIESFNSCTGLINVILEKINEEVIIKISDNGKGIESHLLPLLCKSNVTFGKKNGTGFGLYNAQKYMDCYKGTLNINSTVGIGTTVIVAFKNESKSKKAIYMLEDESVFRMAWQKAALNTEQKIQCFSNTNDFFEATENAEKDSVIVLDMYINGVKSGPNVVDKISRMGFCNIYICTSAPDDFMELKNLYANSIRGIIPKKPETALEIIAKSYSESWS